VDQLVLAIECDPASDIVCTPEFVNELFETPVVFSLGGFDVNRVCWRCRPSTQSLPHK